MRNLTKKDEKRVLTKIYQEENVDPDIIPSDRQACTCDCDEPLFY